MRNQEPSSLFSYKNFNQRLTYSRVNIKQGIVDCNQPVPPAPLLLPIFIILLLIN